MLERMKQRWGITSTWRVVVICLVFSLAGMSIVPARKVIFHLLHIPGTAPFALKLVAWMVFVFPMYQLFLIVYGTLLGEFHFFWEKEKAMMRWIARRFSPPAASD